MDSESSPAMSLEPSLDEAMESQLHLKPSFVHLYVKVVELEAEGVGLGVGVAAAPYV